MKLEWTVMLTMIEVSFLTHESGDRVLRARNVKDIAFGVLRVKTMGPQALEVDRVYQNQVSIFRNAGRRQEVANVAFRHIADPIIDLIPHLLGICMEVGHLQLIPEDIEHAVAQLLGIRDPKSIGDIVLVGICGSIYLKWKISKIKKSFLPRSPRISARNRWIFINSAHTLFNFVHMRDRDF